MSFKGDVIEAHPWCELGPATLADDVKQTFKITFKRTTKWNIEKHKYKLKRRKSSKVTPT